MSLGDPLSLLSEHHFPLYWEMTLPERLALIALLAHAKPQHALEVGCFLGGSLQVLAAYSHKVTSIDIDPEVPERLGTRFSNVAFRIGDSGKLLITALAEASQQGEPVDFILLDGRHSASGVIEDVSRILESACTKEQTVLIHDSFNPSCRRGLESISWASHASVHYVEIDFVPGVFRFDAERKCHTLWGGFACVRRSPTAREAPLEVQRSYQEQFRALAEQGGLS